MVLKALTNRFRKAGPGHPAGVLADESGSPRANAHGSSVAALGAQKIAAVGAVAADDPGQAKAGKFTTSTRSAIVAALGEAKKRLAESLNKSFTESYKTSKIVGHGAFARVVVATHIRTGKEYAAKIVTKKEDDGRQMREILKEIAIMEMIKDHPNVIKLFDVFESQESYTLVLELCTGGELFDEIIHRGHFTEKEAAEYIRCIVDFIRFAHERGIIHRDLKPENILLKDKSRKPVLKIIDFGTSDFCAEGQKLSHKFGTPYYVAPEVLKKSYDKQADVWSAGVIFYILLCGYPPFGGRTDEIILQRVQQGHFSFDGKEWATISAPAKDMIKRMLVMDPAVRSTPATLLQHPWFQDVKVSPQSSLGAHMMSRLNVFAGMSRLKRLALVVLARTLTDRDVRRLRELFESMDTKKSGRLEAKPFHDALERIGAAIDTVEMKELFMVCSIDGTGLVDYNEFIAAMLDTDRVSRRKEAVRRSFDELDTDGDGVISAADIMNVTKGRMTAAEARDVLGETGRERLSFEEFERIMKS